MKVIWHPLALANRRNIADYILNKFGNKSKKKFLKAITDKIHLIKLNPDIAPIDPLFETYTDIYSSVIIDSLSKMVYYVETDTIHIAGFWDCRSEPSSQAKRVK